MDSKNKTLGDLGLDRDRALRNLFRSLAAYDTNIAEFSSLIEVFFKKRMDQMVVIQGLRVITSKKEPEMPING